MARVHERGSTHLIVLSPEPDTKSLLFMATLSTLPLCPTKEAFSSLVVRSHTLHDTGWAQSLRPDLLNTAAKLHSP